jgi:hypothetical protein
MMQLKFKMNNSSSNAENSEEEPASIRRIRTPSFENKIEKEKQPVDTENKNIQKEINNMINQMNTFIDSVPSTFSSQIMNINNQVP